MKKFLTVLLCIAMVFSMLGCQSEAPAPTEAEVPETIAATSPAETEAPTQPETQPTAAPTEPPKPWENNVLMTAPNLYPAPLYVFGHETVTRQQITSITFLDTLADMPENAWDVSMAQDGSVMAWLIQMDLYIAGEGGVMAPEDCEYMFGNYEKLTAINFGGNFHTENVKTMRWMFGYTKILEEIDLSTLDTSSVIDMGMLFDSCYKLKTITFGEWDTSKVVAMDTMFCACRQLESLDLSGFDTSNVATMEGMFNNCWKLQELDLSNFDTSNVMDMNGMFSWCGKLEKVDVSGWDTSNVSDMGLMFTGCPLKEIDVSHFDTANVVRMTQMFDGACFTTIDLSGWDTSKVLDMTSMLDNTFNLTDVNLDTWEVDSVGTNWKNFLEDKVQVDGKPWKELFANAGTAEPKIAVPASNVISEPGIPEDGYDLTVRRNLPLSISAKFALAEVNDPSLPDVENMMIDDIPILLCAGESSDSMPITIYLHGGGGCKENYMTSARYTALNTGGYAICIDGGAYGESPRGTMSDGETICMWVNDIDKVIAYCSTLPGADLGRISLHGASMGGSGVLSYLARGSFTPIYAYAGIAGADFTNTPTTSPLFSIHGENARDIPAMNAVKIKQLTNQYCPLQHAENMMDTYLCVVVGLQDDADAVKSNQDLEAKFSELGKTNCEFNYYDVGHTDTLGYDAVQRSFLETVRNGTPMNNPAPKVTVTVIAE